MQSLPSSNANHLTHPHTANLIMFGTPPSGHAKANPAGSQRSFYGVLIVLLASFVGIGCGPQIPGMGQGADPQVPMISDAGPSPADPADEEHSDTGDTDNDEDPLDEYDDESSLGDEPGNTPAEDSSTAPGAERDDDATDSPGDDSSTAGPGYNEPGADAGAGNDGSETGADEGSMAELYLLEAEGAYGGGMYPAGSEVHLFGALDPVFEHNLGFEVVEGEVALQNADEWHATLIMPANDVRVRYRSETISTEVSELVVSSVTGRDITLRYHRVANPTGIIFLLHGSGGSSQILETVEARAFAASAVARGYTVVAPEAEESVAGDLNGDGKTRWNVQPSPNNVDFQNLNRLVTMAKNQGWASDETPFYVAGMSNGGAMAVTLGAIASSASPLRDVFPELRFQAVVSFCATGPAMIPNITETPSAWFMAAEDSHPQVGTEAIEEAQGFSQSLISRNVDTDFAVHVASPLFDERFLRVPGIDLATSRAVIAEFQNAGFLDEEKFCL